MKFIINTANLKSGGGLQVAASLLLEWQDSLAEHEFHLILSPQFTQHISGIKLNKNFLTYELEQNPNVSLKAWLKAKKQIDYIEKEAPINATFTIFGPSLLATKSPQLIGFANGFYLFNDDTFIQDHLQNRPIQKWKYDLRRKLILRRLKKEGDHYWVETAKAKEKLSKSISMPQQKITVVGNCASKQITYKRSTVRTNQPFRLLYLSAYYEHKNFEIIPRVIPLLEEQNINLEFVVCLDENRYQKIFGHTNQRYLRNMGIINSMSIDQIYHAADAVFIPSLLETFSANYPEAMAAGLPILCSDLDFARDICSNAAIYFNPYNPEDIATKIVKLVHDYVLQQELRVAGLDRLKNLESPKSRAQKLLQLLVHIGSKE